MPDVKQKMEVVWQSYANVICTSLLPARTSDAQMVAVTITPDAVLFPAIDRRSALSPRVRAEEWEREGTSAEIVPAAGLNAARVVFTRLDNGKRRRRTVNAGTIDVDPRVIVDVLGGART